MVERTIANARVMQHSRHKAKSLDCLWWVLLNVSDLLGQRGFLVNNLLCTYPIYAMQVKTIWYQSNEETLSTRL